MRRVLIVAVIVLVAAATATVGAFGFLSDTSAVGSRVESRPTFIYNCITCHG